MQEMAKPPVLQQLLAPEKSSDEGKQVLHL